MTNVTRVLTALFALIALATGALAVVGGIAETSVPVLVDNEFRFFAGIWFAAGLGLAYCAATITESTKLFRFLMIAIFIGGIARAIGLTEYSPERKMIVGIAIETVLPSLLLIMQSRITKP